MITSEGQALSPSRKARIVAVLCSLWCWLGPILVLSLIVRLTTATRDPFLRAVTGEVLNLQLAALLPVALVVVALAVGWSALAWVG